MLGDVIFVHVCMFGMWFPCAWAMSYFHMYACSVCGFPVLGHMICTFRPPGCSHIIRERSAVGGGGRRNGLRYSCAKIEARLAISLRALPGESSLRAAIKNTSGRPCFGSSIFGRRAAASLEKHKCPEHVKSSVIRRIWIYTCRRNLACRCCDGMLARRTTYRSDSRLRLEHFVQQH